MSRVSLLKSLALSLGTTAALLIAALSMAPADASAGPRGGDEAAATLCFSVADADQEKQLPGVEVSAVSAEGLSPLGTTDRSGTLCLDKEETRGKKPLVILFCKPGFFCGAFRTDQVVAGYRFFDFGEHFIALTPFKIG